MSILLDAFVLILLGWFAVRGFQKGLVRQVFHLAALFLAGGAALIASDHVAALLVEAGLQSELSVPVACLLLFIVVLIVLEVLIAALVRLVRKSSLSMWDRVLGGVLGTALLTLILSFIFTFIGRLPVVRRVVDQSLVVPWVAFAGSLVVSAMPDSLVGPMPSPGMSIVQNDRPKTVSLPDDARRAKVIPERARDCDVFVDTTITSDGSAQRQIRFIMNFDPGTAATSGLHDAFSMSDAWNVHERRTPHLVIFTATSERAAALRIPGNMSEGKLELKHHLLSLEYYWQETVELSSLLGVRYESPGAPSGNDSALGARLRSGWSHTRSRTNHQAVSFDHLNIRYTITFPSETVQLKEGVHSGNKASIHRRLELGHPLTVEARCFAPRTGPRAALTLVLTLAIAGAGFKSYQLVMVRRSLNKLRRNAAKRMLHQPVPNSQP